LEQIGVIWVVDAGRKEPPLQVRFPSRFIHCFEKQHVSFVLASRKELQRKLLDNIFLHTLFLDQAKASEERAMIINKIGWLESNILL